MPSRTYFVNQDKHREAVNGAAVSPPAFSTNRLVAHSVLPHTAIDHDLATEASAVRLRAGAPVGMVLRGMLETDVAVAFESPDLADAVSRAVVAADPEAYVRTTHGPEGSRISFSTWGSPDDVRIGLAEVVADAVALTAPTLSPAPLSAVVVRPAAGRAVASSVGHTGPARGHTGPGSTGPGRAARQSAPRVVA